MKIFRNQAGLNGYKNNTKAKKKKIQRCASQLYHGLSPNRVQMYRGDTDIDSIRLARDNKPVYLGVSVQISGQQSIVSVRNVILCTPDISQHRL